MKVLFRGKFLLKTLTVIIVFTYVCRVPWVFAFPERYPEVALPRCSLPPQPDLKWLETLSWGEEFNCSQFYLEDMSDEELHQLYLEVISECNQKLSRYDIVRKIGGTAKSFFADQPMSFEEKRDFSAWAAKYLNWIKELSEASVKPGGSIPGAAGLELLKDMSVCITTTMIEKFPGELTPEARKVSSNLVKVLDSATDIEDIIVSLSNGYKVYAGSLAASTEPSKLYQFMTDNHAGQVLSRARSYLNAVLEIEHCTITTDKMQTYKDKMDQAYQKILSGLREKESFMEGRIHCALRHGKVHHPQILKMPWYSQMLARYKQEYKDSNSDTCKWSKMIGEEYKIFAQMSERLRERAQIEEQMATLRARFNSISKDCDKRKEARDLIIAMSKLSENKCTEKGFDPSEFEKLIIKPDPKVVALTQRRFQIVYEALKSCQLKPVVWKFQDDDPSDVDEAMEQLQELLKTRKDPGSERKYIFEGNSSLACEEGMQEQLRRFKNDGLIEELHLQLQAMQDLETGIEGLDSFIMDCDFPGGLVELERLLSEFHKVKLRAACSKKIRVKKILDRSAERRKEFEAHQVEARKQIDRKLSQANEELKRASELLREYAEPIATDRCERIEEAKSIAKKTLDLSNLVYLRIGDRTVACRNHSDQEKIQTEARRIIDEANTALNNEFNARQLLTSIGDSLRKCSIEQAKLELRALEEKPGICSKEIWSERDRLEMERKALAQKLQVLNRSVAEADRALQDAISMCSAEDMRKALSALPDDNCIEQESADRDLKRMLAEIQRWRTVPDAIDAVLTGVVPDLLGQARTAVEQCSPDALKILDSIDEEFANLDAQGLGKCPDRFARYDEVSKLRELAKREQVIVAELTPKLTPKLVKFNAAVKALGEKLRGEAPADLPEANFWKLVRKETDELLTRGAEIRADAIPPACFSEVITRVESLVAELTGFSRRIAEAPQFALVPSIKGASAEVSKEALHSAGRFVLHVIGGDRAPSKAQEFTVQEQYPAANTELRVQAVVKAKFYSGYEVEVPPVINRLEGEALGILESALLKGEVALRIPTADTTLVGRVFAEDPPAWSKIEPHSIVRLNVYSQATPLPDSVSTEPVVLEEAELPPESNDPLPPPSTQGIEPAPAREPYWIAFRFYMADIPKAPPTPAAPLNETPPQRQQRENNARSVRQSFYANLNYSEIRGFKEPESGQAAQVFLVNVSGDGLKYYLLESFTPGTRYSTPVSILGGGQSLAGAFLLETVRVFHSWGEVVSAYPAFANDRTFLIHAAYSDGQIASTIQREEQQIEIRGGPLAAGWSEEMKRKNFELTKSIAAAMDCFIVTVVYNGNLFTPELAVFRRFRDDVLKNTPAGRSLIDTYYEYGPLLALHARSNTELRLLLRKVLNVAALYLNMIDMKSPAIQGSAAFAAGIINEGREVVLKHAENREREAQVETLWRGFFDQHGSDPS